LLWSLKTSASWTADKIAPSPQAGDFLSFFITLLIDVAPRPETRRRTHPFIDWPCFISRKGGNEGRHPKPLSHHTYFVYTHIMSRDMVSGLTIGFIGLVDTARDYTLQFTVTFTSSLPLLGSGF
jgi:hypothetical protein